MSVIGIRREDKSPWEARVPLVPEDIRRLRDDHGVGFQVQSASRRAFDDDAFVEAGAEIVDHVTDCRIVLGVKEIPTELLQAECTYLYFSHTVKGQPDNMPALKRLLELGCTLIDYEKIVDEQDRRLVFFGRHAGLAGMIDTLWTLGRRLDEEGVDSPFARIEPAHRYRDLTHANEVVRAVADEIKTNGLPATLAPFVCGFTGYGQVSRGAQEIFDLLPVQEVAPQDLASLPADPNTCFKVVFKEADLVVREPAGAFALQEYYDHPERYRSVFFPYVQHLGVLVNCIYWEPRYPRLVTADQFKELYAGSDPVRLRVIGDITCDIDGSLACTRRATTPDNPVYVYDPQTGGTRDGLVGRGPVVLAVDFLPCELPVDASITFSRALTPLIPAFRDADLSGPFDSCGLPAPLRKATVVYRGELTPDYAYLAEFVNC